MKNYIIAFDIGGTRIKYGVVSLEGKMLESGVMPSYANGGTDALFHRISRFIDSTIKARGINLSGIGLGLTGGVDQDTGVVLLPGKFKSLEQFPIVPLLREKYNTIVFADNDGRLAAYAEQYFGSAVNKKWAVVVTIGTGIGSGVIIDGKILHDPNLQFGTQLGHLIIDKSSEKICLTGNVGTGEILCSANALAMQVRDAIQRGIPSVLTDDYFVNPLNIDFEKVIIACRNNDELCLRELDIWINKLSLLLINAVHAYAPQIIILSGGAVLGADLFLDEVIAKVNKQVFRYPQDSPIEIVVSNIREYTGVMGAAALIMEKLKIVNKND